MFYEKLKMKNEMGCLETWKFNSLEGHCEKKNLRKDGEQCAINYFLFFYKNR